MPHYHSKGSHACRSMLLQSMIDLQNFDPGWCDSPGIPTQNKSNVVDLSRLATSLCPNAETMSSS